VATESGPDGYLGSAAEARALLQRHDLVLVGGFLPLVLHDPARLDGALVKARRAAALFAGLGAGVLCSAAVVDDGWSPRVALDDQGWDRLVRGLALVDEAVEEYGVRHVLHPHWGTLVEQDADVRRVLATSSVRICLDTGHLVLGGSDPLEVARVHAERVGHVHLKDVRAGVAARLRSGELDLVHAVRLGLFQPLGRGDVPVGEVVLALERSAYDGWYVIEQDTAVLGEPPQRGTGPVDDVRTSIAFLRGVAEQTGPPLAAAAEGR
jgi:inosose dehydratase